MPPSNYRAVIFDLDGTLLNTLEDIASCTNRVLRTNGFPRHPTDAYRYFVGQGAAVLIRKALPSDIDNQVVFERCLAQFIADYQSNWNVTTCLYDGIAQMLDDLKDAALRLAVLSNKPHAETRRCVDHYLADWHFDFVFGQRPEVPPKPDPTAARMIAKAMRLPAGAFIYVGDTPIDMQTAAACGMLPVGVGWGFRPPRELIESGAAVVINAPEDLAVLTNHGD